MKENKIQNTFKALDASISWERFKVRPDRVGELEASKINQRLEKIRSNPPLKKRTNKKYVLQFDGSTLGNPGDSAIGVVCYEGKKEIFAISKFIGKKTNNEAEYLACIEGIQKCVELGLENISIQGDSMLVVNQIRGDWRCKKSHLRDLCIQANELLDQIKKWKIQWIPREENSRADELSNLPHNPKDIEKWNAQIKRWKAYKNEF